MKAELQPDPRRPDRHIDPETGIWPIAEWGSECSRGFVSDSRFGQERVIKRTNRESTRKWRQLNHEDNGALSFDKED